MHPPRWYGAAEHFREEVDETDHDQNYQENRTLLG
jgi:hypothetical protein